MAEYKGKKVALGKVMRIRPGEPGHGRKKSKVFVKKNGKVKKGKKVALGKVKKVMFGDPNMTIKKGQPGRRKNFRARHNCDNPGPKDKARYWACKTW